jgi:hypothetical protein
MQKKPGIKTAGKAISYREIAIICVILLMLTLAGCAKMPAGKVGDIERHDPMKILPPIGATALSDGKVQDIINKIEERNRTVEDDPDWIKRAYSGLMVRKLTNVSRAEYGQFEKYLDNGAVYIMVHPDFFPFFHYPKKIVDNTSPKFSKKNVVEKLLSRKPPDFEFALLQSQERRTRDFLEFKSTQEKLVIVVVPKNYHKYSGYTYKRGRDEYMRFLNEITNLSKSVLFVESRSPNRGYLTENNAVILMEFLLTIKAKELYLGGGYVGRCLEDFYSLLIEEYGGKGTYIIPELSDISPRELNNALAEALLRTDGSIDKELSTNIMLRDVYNIQEVRPAIKNLQ